MWGRGRKCGATHVVNSAKMCECIRMMPRHDHDSQNKKALTRQRQGLLGIDHGSLQEADTVLAASLTRLLLCDCLQHTPMPRQAQQGCVLHDIAEQSLFISKRMPDADALSPHSTS